MTGEAMERRDFLKTGLLAPALGWRTPGTVQAARHSSFDPWVDVHAANLLANAAAVRKRTGVPILAVIKNNGYGAGVVNVARALSASPHIAGFAVIKLHEAHGLRDAGITSPILLMGPAADDDLPDLARRGIALMVYTPIAAALGRAAAATGRDVDVHVCVDTGLGRVGVPYRQAFDLVAELARTRGVRLRGIMMTFTEDAAFDREQLQRFRDVTAKIKSSGIEYGAAHAASSYTLFQHPDAFLDTVRPGMALYGIYPEPAFRTSGALALAPAIALRARVAYVKPLQAGESAGYNRAYVAERPVWVATLPVGHADGLPRIAAKGGRVRIGGRLYPIIASVSASHTIVEIGESRSVDIGDEATLFDWTAGSRPEDLAAACGASVYDLTMHLNPLLPRRVVGG
jgi:alanine racemase